MKTLQIRARPTQAPTLAGRAAVTLTVAGLLYFSWRDVSVWAVTQALGRLHVWQVMVVLALDAAVFILMTARWWLTTHTTTRVVQFLSLLAVRLMAFAVSYFTVGPQIGGEPIQVFYLHQRLRLTYVRATASVLLDKLLELMANFVFLVLGLAALIATGVITLAGSTAAWCVAGLVLIATLPIVHLLVLRGGRQPLSGALIALRVFSTHGRTVRFVRASERLAGQFCARNTGSLLAAISVSLLACAGAVVEYAFIASCWGIHLTVPKLVAAWAAGWLSFLVPVPAGIGALEASQVVVLGIFGIPTASAVAVTLLMRGRDMILGGTGLLFAASAAHLSKSKRGAEAVLSRMQSPGMRERILSVESAARNVEDG